MTALDEYFSEVERLGLGSRDEILARVLHVDGAASRHARSIVPVMTSDTAELLEQLDLAVRVRNPGVHYVRRSHFLGYRREGSSSSSVGARSQIFLSVVPRRNRLLLVFVPPRAVQFGPSVSVIEGGHHGVGTHQCSLHTPGDVAAFVRDFESLLLPDPEVLTHPV